MLRKLTSVALICAVFASFALEGVPLVVSLLVALPAFAGETLNVTIIDLSTAACSSPSP